jgi:hypothetical protein
MSGRSFAALAGFLVSFALAGCSVPGSGPSCSEFLNMNNDDKRSAVIDWAKDNDDRVDADNPDAGQSGFAMFQNQASMTAYCSGSGHGDDHLGDLKPT